MTKKVCIVTSYAPSAVNFRSSLIGCLISSGCDVIVLAPDHSPETRDQLEALGASIRHFSMDRLGTSLITDLRSFVSLYDAIRACRPDIVLTYFAKPNIFGILAALCARVEWRVAMVEGMGYVFTQDTNGRRTPKQIVVGWLVLCLYRFAFAAANRVVVLNSDDLHDLQRSCGLELSKAVLLGGIGVCLSEWKMQPPHEQPITFTMVARLLREKGVFEFLNAAKLINSEFPLVRFLLLGGLDSNPGAISRKDLQPWMEMGCVDILGHVDVMPHLRCTSVFVLPSYREGVPRSTQEAMAMGRPVITTDVPGCRETVLHNINGFLVPPRDHLALAQAMKRFVLQPEIILSMGRESRRIAEERFDVLRANAKIIEVLGA